MDTSSAPASAPSSAPISTDAPVSSTPSSAPVTAGEQTTAIVHGTTVIGTGPTGDVWSYTIPDATIVSPVLSTSPATDTLLLTNVVVPGTTVTGGMETGVPWSYTIPDSTFVSSLFVPVTPTATSAPTFSPSDTLSQSSIPSSESSSPTPSSSFGPSTSQTPSSTPSPIPPASAPSTQNTVLTGGVVAIVFGALLLFIFAGAAFACLRLRKRRRHLGSEWDRVNDKDKGVGVVWGHGWGTDEKSQRARARARPGPAPGQGQGGSSSGGRTTPAGTGWHGGTGGMGTIDAWRREAQASRGRENVDPEMGVAEPWRSPDERREERYGPELNVPGLLPPSRTNEGNTESLGPMPTNANMNTNITTVDDPYPAPTQYPHAPTPNNPSTHDVSQLANTNPNPKSTSNLNVSSSADPNMTPAKPRIIPPPTPHIYAPPPGTTPDPSPTYLTPSRTTSPFSTRPTSPYAHRPTSPMRGPNRLSKQRNTPAASALMRHMIPTRGNSLRRSRAPTVPPVDTTADPVTAPPTRPGINTLPSFIRDRQFAPARADTLSPPSESALFSPKPRSRNLPHHAYASSRDGLLSPPPVSRSRDRYSQMTSGTGRSGESRQTGRSDSRQTHRSGDSRFTGRSGDSRLTGRSGGSRFTGRSGGLEGIREGIREGPKEGVVPPGLPGR